MVRRNSDDDARRSAAGRTVLLLFALGAHRACSARPRTGWLMGSTGSAHRWSAASKGAHSSARRSWARCSRPARRRSNRRRRSASAARSTRLPSTARRRPVARASSRSPMRRGTSSRASSGTPPTLAATLAAQPTFLRRALASGSYGLSGIKPGGIVFTALPFRAEGGTRVQVSGVQAKLLAAFLGGTLKQVSTTSSSTSLIIDDTGSVIAEQGPRRAGRPAPARRDAARRRDAAHHRQDRRRPPVHQPGDRHHGLAARPGRHVARGVRAGVRDQPLAALGDPRHRRARAGGRLRAAAPGAGRRFAGPRGQHRARALQRGPRALRLRRVARPLRAAADDRRVRRPARAPLRRPPRRRGPDDARPRHGAAPRGCRR